MVTYLWFCLNLFVTNSKFCSETNPSLVVKYVAVFIYKVKCNKVHLCRIKINMGFLWYSSYYNVFYTWDLLEESIECMLTTHTSVNYVGWGICSRGWFREWFCKQIRLGVYKIRETRHRFLNIRGHFTHFLIDTCLWSIPMLLPQAPVSRTSWDILKLQINRVVNDVFKCLYFFLTE